MDVKDRVECKFALYSPRFGKVGTKKLFADYSWDITKSIHFFCSLRLGVSVKTGKCKDLSYFKVCRLVGIICALALKK